MKKHERIHNDEEVIVPVKSNRSRNRSSFTNPLTPPRQSEMSLSPNPTMMSHPSSLRVPISPPHSTATYSDGKDYYYLVR